MVSVVAPKLDFCVRDRIWLGFSVRIESDLFFARGIEIDRVRAEISFFWVWWSIELVFVWVVVVEIDSVCWGCSRTRCRDIGVTVFGVSTWNNGDVSGECSYLVSSGVPTVLLYFIFCSLPLRDDVVYVRTISVFYISSTPFEPIPTQPETRV